MEIVLAGSAGFCMGVRRAIKMAEEVAAEEGGTVLTYGPLIHNPQELEILEEQGIRAIGHDEGADGRTVVYHRHTDRLERQQRRGGRQALVRKAQHGDDAGRQVGDHRLCLAAHHHLHRRTVVSRRVAPGL